MDLTFIMLINVKMSSIVDILTFISMTDTTSESLGTAHYLSVRGGGGAAKKSWYMSLFQKLLCASGETAQDCF